MGPREAEKDKAENPEEGKMLAIEAAPAQEPENQVAIYEGDQGNVEVAQNVPVPPEGVAE